MRDLYEVMGVSRTATPEELKRAYRKLAKENHPDRNPGNAQAETRFKEVQHAYSILGDKEKRAQYDQFGEVGAGDFRTGPAGEKVYTWGGDDGNRVNVDDLESLFEMFGGLGGGGGGGRQRSPFERIFRQGGQQRARKPAPVKGQDIRRRINLSFQQAVKGVQIEVDVHPPTGGKRETIEVRIPPGVEDGQTIRVPGKGARGSDGGSPGDLLLTLAIREDKVFRRDGNDLIVDVPVTITEAALGAKVEVPTLDGVATVKIPAGTSSGAKLRLAGRGVPAHASRSAGDLYAVVKIIVPKKLSDDQKELLEKLAPTLEENPRAELFSK
jgi:DnaJ-class molecular chaperone